MIDYKLSRRNARFTLATGLREANVIGFEWSQVELERRVAWIHPDQAKVRKAIVVPLNADAVVVKHPRWAFVYKVDRVSRANNHCGPH